MDGWQGEDWGETSGVVKGVRHIHGKGVANLATMTG